MFAPIGNGKLIASKEWSLLFTFANTDFGISA